MTEYKIDHNDLQHRLKEDELLHFVQEMRDNFKIFYETHGRQFVLAVAIIGVVVVAAYFWQLKSFNDAQAAQLSYSNALVFVQSEEYDKALTELNSLLEKYSGSRVAAMAYILRGDCFKKTGEFNRALQDYKTAISKLSVEDAIVARFAMTQTLRSLSQTDEALQELDRIEKQAKSPIMKEQVLYFRGGCYEDKNDVAKAIESYKAIPPKSRWYSLAVERIAWLEAQPAAAIGVK